MSLLDPSTPQDYPPGFLSLKVTEYLRTQGLSCEIPLTFLLFDAEEVEGSHQQDH